MTRRLRAIGLDPAPARSTAMGQLAMQLPGHSGQADGHHRSKCCCTARGHVSESSAQPARWLSTKQSCGHRPEEPRPYPLGLYLTKDRVRGRHCVLVQRPLPLVTVIVMREVTASGLTPLVAVTLNVALPALVGVPDRTPVLASRLNPAGSAPEDT